MKGLGARNFSCGGMLSRLGLFEVPNIHSYGPTGGIVGKINWDSRHLEAGENLGAREKIRDLKYLGDRNLGVGEYLRTGNPMMGWEIFEAGNFRD